MSPIYVHVFWQKLTKEKIALYTCECLSARDKVKVVTKLRLKIVEPGL